MLRGANSNCAREFFQIVPTYNPLTVDGQDLFDFQGFLSDSFVKNVFD